MSDRRGLLAAFEDALADASERVIPAYRAQSSYRPAIRTGIQETLRFFDQKPALARLLIVDSLTAGEPALARRRQVIAVLTDAVDRGRTLARAPRTLTRTTARCAVGGGLSILHERLTGRSAEPLLSLAGELTAIMILPYAGPAAAAREARRPLRHHDGHAGRHPDPLAQLPIRLTYKTVLVLHAIAEQDGRRPGLSNRQIAEAAGIIDPSQISKLLGRLARHGLIENAHQGAAREGKANNWTLTRRGASVQRAARGVPG